MAFLYYALLNKFYYVILDIQMWSAALKEYAKQTGKFIVPKKGSPEYEAVTKIKDKLSQPAPEPEVKAPKKRKEAVAPPPDPELEKKLEEERKLKLELDAKEAAKAARAAKKALQEATRARLNKEREDIVNKQQAKAAIHAQDQATIETSKKLKVQKVNHEEIAAHQELSIKKIKERADKKIEKKLAARQRGEPSFRIEDKQIIISFKD